MRVLAVLMLLTVFAVSAYSQQLPVVIESQKLTYDNRQKIAHYVGSVVAQHDKTVITGDRLDVYFDRSGKHIEKIVVRGNVHIKDPRGEGWCDKLVYYPFEEKAVLIGNAKLKQKKNLIIGDRIVAYRDGRVSVEGIKERVKSVIYPASE